VLKGKKGQRYNERLFDTSGWVSNEDGTYRYKLFEEEYMGKDKNGKKEARTRKVPSILGVRPKLIWQGVSGRRSLKRPHGLSGTTRIQLEKVSMNTQKKMSLIKRPARFWKTQKKLRSVDLKKAEKDALYDGYSCIITSELDYDETNNARKVYGGTLAD